MSLRRMLEGNGFFIVYFQLSSVHSILATQLGDSMMYPLNKFIQADLDGICN